MAITICHPIILYGSDVCGDEIRLALGLWVTQSCRDLGIKIQHIAGFHLQALSNLLATNERALDIFRKEGESYNEVTQPSVRHRHPGGMDLFALIDERPQILVMYPVTEVLFHKESYMNLCEFSAAGVRFWFMFYSKIIQESLKSFARTAISK